MPHNINSMGYYGAEPWLGLGVKLIKRPTASEMIRAAGLDWKVAKVPILNPGSHRKESHPDSKLCERL
jgi:hypothetical protein